MLNLAVNTFKFKAFSSYPNPETQQTICKREVINIGIFVVILPFSKAMTDTFQWLQLIQWGCRLIKSLKFYGNVHNSAS